MGNALNRKLIRSVLSEKLRLFFFFLNSHTSDCNQGSFPLLATEKTADGSIVICSQPLRLLETETLASWFY